MKVVKDGVFRLLIIVVFFGMTACDSGGGGDSGDSEAQSASSSSSSSGGSKKEPEAKAESCSPKVSVSISHDKSVAMMSGSCLPKGGMAELQVFFRPLGGGENSVQGTVGSDGLISLSVALNPAAGNTQVIVDGRVELVTDTVAREEKTFDL